MRYQYIALLTLLLLASGCSNSNATPQNFAQSYWYSGLSQTASCQNFMTIGGGLRQKCGATTVAAVAPAPVPVSAPALPGAVSR